MWSYLVGKIYFIVKSNSANSLKYTKLKGKLFIKVMVVFHPPSQEGSVMNVEPGDLEPGDVEPGSFMFCKRF